MSLRDSAKNMAAKAAAEAAEKAEILGSYLKDLKEKKCVISYGAFTALCKECGIKGGLAARMAHIPKDVQFIVAPKPKRGKIVHSPTAIAAWGKDYRPKGLINQDFNKEPGKEDWVYVENSDDVLEDFKVFKSNQA